MKKAPLSCMLISLFPMFLQIHPYKKLILLQGTEVLFQPISMLIFWNFKILKLQDITHVERFYPEVSGQKKKSMKNICTVLF